MRTIEFRGYNRKNNEWLHGFYLQNRGAHFVCPDEFATNKSWEDYEVDPETVGQFTGLLDKNDKKIYEGDILPIGEDRYVCEFVEGGFEFRDMRDNRLIPKAIVHHTEVIGNIHDNPELIEH